MLPSSKAGDGFEGVLKPSIDLALFLEPGGRPRGRFTGVGVGEGSTVIVPWISSSPSGAGRDFEVELRLDRSFTRTAKARLRFIIRRNTDKKLTESYAG